MSSQALSEALSKIDTERLDKAKTAFLSIDKAFTVRRRKVVGEDQFNERMRRAIAAYNANSSI